MAAVEDLFGSVIPGGFGGGGIVNLAIYSLFAATILGSIIGVFYWIYSKKKKWWIKVEFKIPRSDGKIINSEWGGGAYDAKRGVVFVKRKGKKPVPMKPFDIKKYFQGKDTLTVVQVGIEDYRPVLQESYLEMVDEETNEEAALIRAKIDTSESRAWRNTFERDAKSAYSLMGLIKEHFQLIALGLVIFLWGIQFLVIYNAVKG